MGKIDDIIKEKKLKSHECQYHTNRRAMNKKNQSSGNIRVLAVGNVAHVEYTCPECKHQAYAEQEWKRPFSVKCAKCGYKISVPKMKAQAKRELKAES